MTGPQRLPIGVFDSGVGGLTVLKSLTELLPREDFIYVGDTARVPYGTKSAEAVRRFSLEIAGFLARRKVKLMVVACNTASALALPDLRRSCGFPVLGVIEPGARAALAASSARKVGVIGTEATIRSGAYEHALHRLAPGLKVFSRACPLFVPLVEEGWVDHPVARATANIYLRPFRSQGVDVLVLGCTHYPLMKSTLKKAVGKIELIDSAEETAKAVRSRLEQDGLLSDGRGSATEFYSSDDPQKFARLGSLFLKRSLGAVRRLTVPR